MRSRNKIFILAALGFVLFANTAFAYDLTVSTNEVADIYEEFSMAVDQDSNPNVFAYLFHPDGTYIGYTGSSPTRTIDNWTGSSLPNDLGVYHIYLMDASVEGCAQNLPSDYVDCMSDPAFIGNEITMYVGVAAPSGFGVLSDSVVSSAIIDLTASVQASTDNTIPIVIVVLGLIIAFYALELMFDLMPQELPKGRKQSKKR